MFYKIISEKTVKVRYKFVSLIMKYLIPSFYQKIDVSTFIKRKNLLFITDNVSITLRPSFRFIKERFKEKLLKGVEIGVDRGINAKSILNGLNIEKLYLIDGWINYNGIQKFRQNINGNYKRVLKMFKNNDNVEIIRDLSINAVKIFDDNSLDFVYIDANHSYKYVYQDISIWYKKIKKNGIISGHDIFQNFSEITEVFEAVRNFCFENNIIFYIEYPDWYFVKR